MCYRAFVGNKENKLMRKFTVPCTMVILLIMGSVEAKSPQFPLVPQFPISVETNTQLCECSKDGSNCKCDYLTDQCGCYAINLYHWVETDKTGHTALYKGKQQIGNWREEEQRFYYLVEDSAENYHWTPGACPADTIPLKKGKGKVAGVVCENGVCRMTNSQPTETQVSSGTTTYATYNSGNCATGNCGSTPSYSSYSGGDTVQYATRQQPTRFVGRRSSVSSRVGSSCASGSCR